MRTHYHRGTEVRIYLSSDPQLDHGRVEWDKSQANRAWTKGRAIAIFDFDGFLADNNFGEEKMKANGEELEQKGKETEVQETKHGVPWS